MSFLKKVMTAKKEPICRLTSIERLWFSKLRRFDIKIKWEEELTGMNSVTPWIKDKINISIINKKIKLKVVFLLAILNAYQVCKEWH